MTDRDKIKTMSQLALYEKKGKKDFNVYSYEKDDYIRFQGLKTAILVTLAFIAIVGIVVLWNMESLISNFDVLNYKLIIGVGLGIFLFLLIFYLIISYRQSRDDYNQMIPRMRRYQRRLKKMKEFHMIADKKQRDFEKGEW